MVLYKPRELNVTVALVKGEASGLRAAGKGILFLYKIPWGSPLCALNHPVLIHFCNVQVLWVCNPLFKQKALNVVISVIHI